MKRIILYFLIINAFFYINILDVKANTTLTSDDLTVIDTSYYFDTYSKISIWSKAPITKDIKANIESIMDNVENTFSPTESMLYTINSNAGKEPVIVSEDLITVIEKAIQYAKISSGKFDPTIGPLIKLWNISPNNKNFSIPTLESLEERGHLVDYDKIEINKTNKSIYLPKEGMILDLGGIAKGYAADQIKDYLLSLNIEHAIINLGGNILTIGNRYTNTEGWRIGIQDPFSPRGTSLGTIEISDKTVVTSGVYERYIEYKGKRYHHIIDPDTYYPVDNEIMSVSIITSTSTDADALSTAVFALGLENGMLLVEELDDVEAIFVTKNYKVVASSKMMEKYDLEISKESSNKYRVVTLNEYNNPSNRSIFPIIIVLSGVFTLVLGGLYIIKHKNNR